MWLMTDAFWHDIAARQSNGAAAATFYGNAAVVGLVAAPFSPGPALTMGELVEATFSGYERKSLGSVSPAVGTHLSPDGFWQTEYPSINWAANDTLGVNTIYGQFLLGSDSATLWGAELFDAPIPISGLSTSFVDVIRLGFSRNTMFGKSVIAP